VAVRLTCRAGNILVRPRPDPPGRLARLLGGGAPRAQLVLLDHGVYVNLPERERRLYCQVGAPVPPPARGASRQCMTEDQRVAGGSLHGWSCQG
jgi:aarF domain-containing kinase